MNTAIPASIKCSFLAFLFMLSSVNADAAEKGSSPAAPVIVSSSLRLDERPLIQQACRPQALIFFQQVPGNTVQEYRIYKNGQLVRKISPRADQPENVLNSYREDITYSGTYTSTNACIQAAHNDETYYTVSAVNSDGNESLQSEKLPVRSFRQRIIRNVCFAGDTLVLIEDGSLKNIQDIKPGERVRSFDFSASRTAAGVVAGNTRTAAASYLVIDKLMVTEHHPFATGRDLWKEAGDLRVGDRVLGLNAEIEIKDIARVNERINVYDLTVSVYSNFYVFNGEQFFLVHNSD